MNILPIKSVETLAAVTARSANTGIVPPWMAQGGNTGIVPPYLRPTPVPSGDRNPGIVPPWLQGPVGPSVPVKPQDPRILGVAELQIYVPQPIIVDPTVPHIM